MTTRTALTAAEIMTKEPVSVTPAMSLREFQQTLNELEVSGAPVIDSAGRLVGVASSTDMIRRMSEGTLDVPPAFMFDLLSDQGDIDQDFEHDVDITVQDIMTEDPVSVTAEEPVSAIARLMAENGIHRVVVVDTDRYPIGIITTLDLLRVFPQ